MKTEWFTSNQLAGAPGLPSTDRNIRSKAKREGWKSRKRAKGKGCEFHISSLPEETRVHLLAQSVTESLAHQDKPTIEASLQIAEGKQKEKAEKKDVVRKRSESLVAFNSLAASQQTRANARLYVLQLRAKFLAPYVAAKQLTQGEKLFVTAYNNGEFGCESWITTSVKKISVTSIRRWEKQLEKEGLSRLGGEYSANKRASLIEKQPELENYLIAVVTGKPHLAERPYVLNRMIEEKLDKFPHWEVPSASSVARWLKKWLGENGAKFANLTNPDAYNSKHRPLFAKMYPWINKPNDCWEFDSTPTDVQLRVDGKLVRYSVIAAIDVYTRRVKLLLAPTSSSEGICLLLRKCLLDWGTLNEGGVARTDNGSDYVSQRVSTIFQMLDIDQSKAAPFSGWEKPYIERFFRTMSQALFELLPGYIGHSVSDRQKIEAARAFAQRIGEGRKKAKQEALELALTPSELEEILNDWLEHRYNHSAHEGMNGATPFSRYVDSGYRPQKVEDAHCLDQLLNYVGDASVIRGGTTAGGIRYTAPELMNPDWDRKRVRVFLDPTDVGRATLYPIGEWGTYVEAVNTDLVGQSIDPARFREERKKHKKALSDFRRTAKKLQNEYGVDTQYAEALAADKARNSLSEFPVPSEAIDNKALQALTKASMAKTEHVRSDEEIERLSRARMEIERHEENVKERKGLVIRNLHDKAKYLALESLTRDLTDKEEAFLDDYKRKNPFGKKHIEEILDKKKKA